MQVRHQPPQSSCFIIAQLHFFPTAAETIMSSGSVGRNYENRDPMVDTGHHRFSTSAKKATQTPPKRKDFTSPSKINLSEEEIRCVFEDIY